MNKKEVKGKLKDNKLPEGWVKTILADPNLFKTIGSGIFPFKRTKLYLSTSSIEGTKIISIEEIITYKKRPSRANMQPRKGLVAFAKMRNTLKVLLVNDELEKNYILSTGFSLIESKISPNYLFQYFLSFFFNHQKNLLAEGTTQEAISNDDFEKMFIIFPSSLPEQQKIAEILETVDETIDKTDAIIEKYKRIKQGLMQDLLTRGIDENGQIRSEETHKFKDSPLGRIPEEWEVVELGEVCRFINGRAFKPNEWSKGGLPIIRIENLNNINAPYNYCNFKVDKKYWISERDLLLSWSGTPGTSFGMFIWNRGEAILNQHIFRVIIEKLLDKKYLYYKFNSMLNEMISQSHGSAGLKHITKSYLDKIKLAISISLSEQRRIAAILSQIDETIEKEQKDKEKIEKLKQGLMEDLLTGKVRVLNAN